MSDQRQNFFQPEKIMDEIKNAIDYNKDKKIDFITFVGEGEPTLCRSLGWLIKMVKQVWDIPVAIDTNSSLFYKNEVRQELHQAEVVMPSLDAGTEQTFRKINRSIKTINLKTVIDGLIRFRKEYIGQIWLEIMLVRGINDSEPELKAIKRQIYSIKPDEIYINVPIRPPSEPWVLPPATKTIELAREILGDIVTITDEEVGDFSVEGFASPIEAIESIVRRHPMRKEQVIDLLKQFDGIDINEVLFQLLETGRVGAVEYNGKIFLVGVDKKSGGNQ